MLTFYKPGIIDMYKIINFLKSIHDTCRALHISACTKRKIRQVTTNIKCQLCSIQLQKEMKSNPKAAQL